MIKIPPAPQRMRDLGSMAGRRGGCDCGVRGRGYACRVLGHFIGETNCAARCRRLLATGEFPCGGFLRAQLHDK